jgi:hypothetical protein
VVIETCHLKKDSASAASSDFDDRSDGRKGTNRKSPDDVGIDSRFLILDGLNHSDLGHNASEAPFVAINAQRKHTGSGPAAIQRLQMDKGASSSPCKEPNDPFLVLSQTEFSAPRRKFNVFEICKSSPHLIYVFKARTELILLKEFEQLVLLAYAQVVSVSSLGK